MSKKIIAGGCSFTLGNELVDEWTERHHQEELGQMLADNKIQDVDHVNTHSAD